MCMNEPADDNEFYALMRDAFNADEFNPNVQIDKMDAESLRAVWRRHPDQDFREVVRNRIRCLGAEPARTWLQRQLDFQRFDCAGQGAGKRWGLFTTTDYDHSIALTDGVIAAADARRELDTTTRSLLDECGVTTTEEIPEHRLKPVAEKYVAARSAEPGDDAEF